MDGDNGLRRDIAPPLQDSCERGFNRRVGEGPGEHALSQAGDLEAGRASPFARCQLLDKREPAA